MDKQGLSKKNALFTILLKTAHGTVGFPLHQNFSGLIGRVKYDVSVGFLQAFHLFSYVEYQFHWLMSYGYKLSSVKPCQNHHGKPGAACVQEAQVKIPSKPQSHFFHSDFSFGFAYRLLL